MQQHGITSRTPKCRAALGYMEYSTNIPLCAIWAIWKAWANWNIPGIFHTQPPEGLVGTRPPTGQHGIFLEYSCSDIWAQNTATMEYSWNIPCVSLLESGEIFHVQLQGIFQEYSTLSQIISHHPPSSNNIPSSTITQQNPIIHHHPTISHHPPSQQYPIMHHHPTISHHPPSSNNWEMHASVWNIPGIFHTCPIMQCDGGGGALDSSSSSSSSAFSSALWNWAPGCMAIRVA